MYHSSDEVLMLVVSPSAAQTTCGKCLTDILPPASSRAHCDHAARAVYRRWRLQAGACRPSGTPSCLFRILKPKARGCGFEASFGLAHNLFVLQRPDTIIVELSHLAFRIYDLGGAGDSLIARLARLVLLLSHAAVLVQRLRAVLGQLLPCLNPRLEGI